MGVVTERVVECTVGDPLPVVRVNLDGDALVGPPERPHARLEFGRAVPPRTDEVAEPVEVVDLAVVDTQCVGLETLDYTRLEDADEYVLEVVTPYVLSSAYPGADDQSIPWWLSRDGRTTDTGLRQREERLVHDGTVYPLETIDHGQVVAYTGNDPIQTAQNGILHVGTHSRFGFGEFRLRPASDDRVPERDGALGERPAQTATQSQTQEGI